MNYYKIIINNHIIGVSTSMDCLRFLNKHSTLERTTIELAEYIECNNCLYHATWMAPIITQLYRYNLATIISIEAEEYNALIPAIENAPITIIEEEAPIIATPKIDLVEELTIDFIRTSKINEMSSTCNQIIESGFDITLSDNLQHHFSLTTQDQLNLMSLSQMAANGMEEIPYHADGEICRFYSAADMNAIVALATAFKIYHTTYYNALKNYINSLDNIQDIAAVTYGIELPEEYQSEVLKALNENNN